MKYQNTLIALISATVMGGCTTVPDRFTQDASIHANCGYSITSSEKNSFALEVFLKQYSFLPSPDSAIQEARECFKKTAKTLAQRNKREINSISLSDMSTSAARNTIDGNFSVYVTGKISYTNE
jgi:hypothetical protein